MSFAMQSPLEQQVSSPRTTAAAPRRVANGERGPSIARWRAARTALLYAGLLLLSIWLVHASGRPDVHALALGLALPGGGFLAWAAADALSMSLGVALVAASALLFLAALGLWFATGNLVLPAIVWLGTAIVAAATISVWPGPFAAYTSRPLIVELPLAMLAALGGATAMIALEARRRRWWHRRFIATTGPWCPARSIASQTPRDEIALDDLRRLRLLLDRALQPVDCFDGFEWIDQFQTSAVRYQINFLSYALSVGSHAYLPAFDGYLATAQRNLVAKQLDHRVWRYWALESLWGHLRSNRDPIARDNIMYSGFLAAQIAYARSSVGICDYDAPGTLRLQHPGGASFGYSLPGIVECLSRQYGAARYGLLACEPGWIYPLCNIMTASGIRAADLQLGTRHWEAMEVAFRHHLRSDFTTADGRLLAFRSSLTGLGTSAVGGAILQALPCLFLNAICPDLAQRQWQRVRHDLIGPRQRRVLWPIDVGNYGFSRAASYAATAAAAVELGDSEIAEQLLGLLDAECPTQLMDGVIHRSRASLWSHAAELLARLGRHNALRALVTKPHAPNRKEPYIKSARYPDLLVAAAQADRETLRAVLYPGVGAGYKPLTIAGLKPSATYVVDVAPEQPFASDRSGEAEICIPVCARTVLHVHPAV
jgi:Linalool dehydratase/isomerase